MCEKNGKLEIKIFALNKIVFKMLQRYCGELALDENVGM